jgi:signal transduction histidine kinase
VGDVVPTRPDTSLGFVFATGRSLTVSDYALETRFKVPQTYLDAGLTSALAVPISDRGRIIGVLALRSRARRVFGDDEARFVESLANLLASSLQRTQSEEALQHAQRLESVGQLTGGIAHDFNNLLTVIQGNLQVLGDLPEVTCGSARELVEAAGRATKRGAELTSKLLAFSRRQVLKPTSVHAGGMLESLANLLNRTLDQRIRIEVDVPEGLELLADPGQLESALLNIAINARDAMPAGGTLRFSAEACAGLPAGVGLPIDGDGEFVQIAVTDTGAGMSDDVKERALEPFFTTKEPGRGTGLGLSTVYGFVTQSKGAITLESELDHGTRVTLYLPRARQTAPASVTVGAGRAVPAGLSVLLVEDDAEVRAVMRRFLESFRCAVTEAASAEQALLLLGAELRPDLLLSDIALGPGMRGTELALRVQERLPSAAVVLMSGFSAELLEADSGSPPHWELLRKPCSREELGAAITRVVAGPA